MSSGQYLIHEIIMYFIKKYLVLQVPNNTHGKINIWTATVKILTILCPCYENINNHAVTFYEKEKRSHFSFDVETAEKCSIFFVWQCNVYLL